MDLRHDCFAGDLNMSPDLGGLGDWPCSFLSLLVNIMVMNIAG